MIVSPVYSDSRVREQRHCFNVRAGDVGPGLMAFYDRELAEARAREAGRVSAT